MGLSLVKGQKISLAKEAGQELSKIIMGLGWDVAKKKGILGFGSSSGSIDLDASCVIFDENKNLIDTVWFGQLKSKDGSITHTGDNLTGDGDGDDEQIIVDLTKVPKNFHSLVFTVNSFRGQTFDQVENAFCRIVDKSNNKEIAKYNLSCQGSHTGQIMAKVYKHNNEWKMHALGENLKGKTVKDLVPMIIPFL